MLLRSWLRDALKALSGPGAYPGRHRAPKGWRPPRFDALDVEWGQALKRMAARRMVAV